MIGWEKAETELALLKRQLEVALQQNMNLEVRVSHLDGALKECARQLGQARDQQEQIIHETVEGKTRELESTKVELESQLVELQTQLKSMKVKNPSFIDQDFLNKIDSQQKENSALKLELLSQSEELATRTVERDLITQTAETASKQQLESIKKVAKLEAECRRLEAIARKLSIANDHKSITTSSIYVESLTDSFSDSGDWLNSVENECEPASSDSWASALIAELDQFKNKKAMTKSLTSCSVEIGIMDDFLEMERLASLPETENKSGSAGPKPDTNQSTNVENSLKIQLDTMIHRMAETEQKLEKVEAEKAELQNALNISKEALKNSQIQLREAKMRLEVLHRELAVVNESKELIELQLIGMEVEARTMAATIDSLKMEFEREHHLSAELSIKCEELEGKITRQTQQAEPQKTEVSNGELKIKQEDLAVAADKLVECQKTIASLGRQLKSLATLEDFLIDTANLPGFSGGALIQRADRELWNSHSEDTPIHKTASYPSKLQVESSDSSVNGIHEQSSASSSLSANHDGSAKTRNSFGKLFTRSKTGIQLENHQG